MNELEDEDNKLNPWNVEGLSDFTYFCCPECAFKSKVDLDFQTHALINHPKAKTFFENLNDIEVNQNEFELESQNEDLKIKTEDQECITDEASKVLDTYILGETFDNDEPWPGQEDYKESEDESDIKPSRTCKKKHNCQYCLRKFSKLSELRLHIDAEHEDHKDELEDKRKVPNKKDYLCEFCLKKFKKIADVKQHIIDEHGEQPKLRCEKCNKDFESTRKLKKHLHGVHMKDRECPHCGQFFTGRGLAVHIESHHTDKNVRQYQCPHCTFNTYAKRYLQSHILTVHDESSKKLICEK